MKALAVPAIFLLAVLAFAFPSIKDDPCEQYADTSHRWQDLRMKPIKIVRLDECVLVYRDDDKGLVNAAGGEDNILQVSNATQVVQGTGERNGVTVRATSLGRKGLKEGQTGVVTYCVKCHYLLQILLEKQ